MVGSHLLSSRVEVADESDPASAFFGATGPRTITVNGEKAGFKFAAHNGLRTRKWTLDDNYSTLQNSDPDEGYVRRIQNKEVLFTSTSTESLTGIQHFREENIKSENLQALFEIDKGFSRVIGGKIVPAFVTYEIQIRKRNYHGDSPVFANVRGTIQGLLKPGQSYKWCHALSYGETGEEEDDTQVDVIFRIIDTDAEISNGRIMLRAAGYNFFNPISQNKTQDLVSER